MPTGLWNGKDIQNSRQNRSKNKLVRERRDTNAWNLLAPGYGLPMLLDVLIFKKHSCSVSGMPVAQSTGLDASPI